ncbi:MAG: EamA family transporter [Candidatus Pacebacteria bacterium]|nr:EamA family transporter [Candidatus Paceibacterota bacterium]
MLEVILILIPIFYAAANLADKYLVTEGDDDDSDPGALLALSGLFAAMFAVPLGLFIFFTGRSLGSMPSIVMLVGLGALYFAAIWIYLDTLKIEDSSAVVSWFQIIPLFGLVGAFFVLNETPQWYHIIGIVALVIGGFSLCYKDGEMKRTIVFWMIISAALIATYDIAFAVYGREIDELSAIFLMLVGKVVAGFVFLALDAKARRGFMGGLTTKFKAQFVSESVNTVADIAMYGSILFFPVMIVQGVAALQPLFVLIGAVLLGTIFPQIEEEGEGQDFRKKVLAITFMIIGGVLLT